MFNPSRRFFVSSLLGAILVLGAPSDVFAQSLTSGALRGAVLSVENDPLNAVQVTLELPDGRVASIVETDRAGRFSIPLLQPGTYRVLIEEIGYQPVRYLGVPVAAGQTTVISARIERRPPPIMEVTEIPWAGALAGSTLGPSFTGRRLSLFNMDLEATNLAQGASSVDAPRAGRVGFVASGNGLSPEYSQLWVDGLPEVLLRHPGVPSEPAIAPLFQRDGLSFAQVMSVGFDTEWRGYPGALLSGHTTRGGNVVSFRPYAFVSSAGMGGAADDNPADSSATSIQVGASLSGAIVPDTAHFFLRFDYQSIRLPTAYPWAQDTSTFEGSSVSIRQSLPEIGSDVFGQALENAGAPMVRSRVGFSGLARFDWLISGNQVVARFGYAKWKEEQPEIGPELSNLFGVDLESTDATAALSVTSGGANTANELRVGFTSTRRDWMSSALPATRLVAEGIAFGNSAALPGKFDQTTFDLSDAFQITLGQHRFKVGGNVLVRDYEQDYRYGSAGVFTFGSLDGFAAGEGTFFQSVAAAGTTAKPRTTDVGGFIQDTWAVSPEIQFQVGVRYDKQLIPEGKIGPNAAWATASGIANDSTPTDSKGLSPRVGVVWDVQNRGEWILTAGGGLYQGRLDPALLSEAILYDGTTTIRRGVGTFGFWPSFPDDLAAPTVGPQLTLFNDTYRTPRTSKAGGGLNRAFANGLALRLSGLFAHTDFLPRRTDLNLVAEPLGETQEGRPIFANLVQRGGMIVAEPTTNRRFDDFDLVSGISPTGFSDYTEFSVSLSRDVPQGISFDLSYTFSKTEDNVSGARTLDPADQLNPFPMDQGGGDWSEGRSDFDVPHRAVAYAEYRSAGSTAFSLGARFRYRSGLPYTPGFRPGVDINGDGSGNNDPAYVDGSISGLSELLSGAGCDVGAVNTFVARNACREDALTALDLRFQIGLPAHTGDGGQLSLVVDAFNVVTTATGIIDRALVLVDPAGTLTPAGPGRVNVPLIVNPNFGRLLVRRADPRMLRVGLRMEY